MTKPLPNKKPKQNCLSINYSVPMDILNAFHQITTENDLNRSKIVARLIAEWIKNYQEASK